MAKLQLKFGVRRTLRAEEKNDMVEPKDIKSREDFSFFLLQLHKDFLLNGLKWENNRLESFLEAMIAYTNDLHGFYKHSDSEVDAEVPSWRSFADILLGATLYE